MSFGQFGLVASTTIASGASTSSDIVFGGRPYRGYVVEVGTMSTAAALTIQHKIASGIGSYRDGYHYVASASTQCVPLVIASGVGAGGGSCFLPVGGLRQIRFIASAVVSGGTSFNVYGFD